MSTFEKMKKIDLHCHLDGSLSIETIRQLADNIGRKLPEEEQLKEKLQVSPDCRDLAAYLACFDLPLSFLVTPQNFKDAVLGVLRDAARENVVYIEIRFSPLQSDGYGMTYEQMIEAALEGLAEGRRQYGVLGNLILCGMRHMDVEANLSMLRAARSYLGEGVCAVDLAGNEAAYPVLMQRAFFEEAKRLELPFTIHAGECGSPESIRNALNLGAARIGHGIAAVKDEALMDELQRRQIPLELCPISNLQTRAVASESEYPFRKFMERGLKLTINTDNRAVSGTSLDREFGWLEKEYGLTLEEARILTENALDAAFASDDVKQALLKQITE
jgi:adenosine deaminase